MPIIDWRLPKLPSVQEVIQQAAQVAQPVVEKLVAPYQPFAQDLYENATRRLATPTEAQSAAAQKLAGETASPQSVSKAMLHGEWGQLFVYPGDRRVWVGQDNRGVDLTPNPQRDAEQQRLVALREANTRALPGAVSRLGLPAALTNGAQVEPSELTIAGRKTAGHTLSTGDGLRFFVPTDPSTTPVGLTPRAKVALETRDQLQQVQRDANDPLKNAAANLTDPSYYGWAAGRIGTGMIDSGKAAVQGTLDTLNPFRKVEPLDFSGWKNGVDILRADPAGSLQSFFKDPANASSILTDTALIAGSSRVSKPGTTSPRDVPASRQTIDVKATTVVDPLPPARTTPRTTTTPTTTPTTLAALPPATTGAALPPATTGAITTSPRSTPTRLTNQADFLRARLTQQVDTSATTPRVPAEFQNAAREALARAHARWDLTVTDAAGNTTRRPAEMMARPWWEDMLGTDTSELEPLGEVAPAFEQRGNKYYVAGERVDRATYDKAVSEHDAIQAQYRGGDINASVTPDRPPGYRPTKRYRADGSNHTVERLQMLGYTGDVPVYYTPGGRTSLPIGQIVPSPSDKASSANQRSIEDILRNMTPVEVSDY